MKKKVFLGLLLICMLLMIGLGTIINHKKEKEGLSFIAQEKKITFDQAISTSNCAVNASFVKLHNKDIYVEYEFKIDEVLYGNVPDSTIYVFSMVDRANMVDTEDANLLEDNKYKENQSYTLIMNKLESIFYDHDRYLLVTDISIPISNFEDCKIYDTPLSEIIDVDDNQGLCGYIKNQKAKEDQTNNKSSKKITSNNLKDIVSNSDLVLEVQIDDIFVEGRVQNSNTYTCTPISNIKGSNYTVNQDGKIQVTLIKNSVKIGEKYVIIINKIDADSTIYYQTSKNGVISITDSKTIDEIKNYLEESDN